MFPMDKKIWDIAVIGGGPAGMMAAGRAAELGATVVLIEKNDTLGKKLLITGGGRCNVTNAEFDNRKLLEKFRENGKFLFSTFSQWSVRETLDFFHTRNMETKIENEKRVFPLSNKSRSVWDTLVAYLKEKNVTILSTSPVSDIDPGPDLTIHLKNGQAVQARKIIIATGGTSHPETGSTGDAFAWLQKLGHQIIKPTASLVPLVTKDTWVKRLAGVSLTNVKISVLLDGVKQNIGSLKKKGLPAPNTKILFTHLGLSGPTILNLSKEIGEMLGYGDVAVSLDLLPDFDHAKLNAKLQEIFKENDKKKFKNSLVGFIPSPLIQIIVELSGIDSEIECNSVTRESRLNLITLLKNLPIRIERLLGEDKAIISSGGVSLEEIDPRTMQSKFNKNIYIVGDLLNIDRPSGGYSLQLCWTTGFVAGTDAAKLV